MADIDEKFPSEDPLNEVIIWPLEIRQRMADALLPHIRINPSTGGIQWISDDHKVDELEEPILELCDAILIMYGHREGRRVGEEKVEELADQIIRWNKEHYENM